MGDAFSQEINSSWFLDAADSVDISAVNHTSIDTSLTGNQVVWSFQGLSETNPLTLFNGQISDVPSGSLFPYANYVPYTIDNPISRYNFYSVSPTEIDQIGSRIEESGLPTVGVFSNAKTFANFPISFGDTETDSFAVSLDALNGQLLYSQSGEHKLVVDGRGTLITPAGTFSDVLRLRSESRYVYAGLPPIPGSDNTGIERNFIWITPSLPGVILLSCQFVLEAGFTNGYAYYANVTNLTTQALSASKEAVFFPNPVVDFINIDHLNPSYEYNLSIFASDGRLVFNNSIGSSFMKSLDVSSLNAGLYILQLKDRNEKSSQRHLFVKQ